MDEKQLVEGCVAGKKSAQRELYNRYTSKMFGVCLRYAPDHDTAQDMLQEGFIRVFSNIGRYKGLGSFEGWIRKIIVNTALEMLRKNDVLRYSADVQVITGVASNLEDSLTQLAAADLVALIQSLPASYRAIFNLYAIEGYSHKEIAEMLEIAEGTSKSQFSRARVWLQKKLPDKYSVK